MFRAKNKSVPFSPRTTSAGIAMAYPTAATRTGDETHASASRETRKQSGLLRSSERIAELGDGGDGIGLRMRLDVVRVIDKKLIGVRSRPL